MVEDYGWPMSVIHVQFFLEGEAVQMTIDHEPNTERRTIENKGGFVSNMPGNLYLISSY